MIAAPHHLISVAEYQRMVAAGAFDPEARIELIDGEILDMAPMGNRHFLAVRELGEQCIAALRQHRAVSVAIQSPIILSPFDEPEPDLVITKRTQVKPQAAEVQVVIEVGDSTLAFDRNEKLPRYARAGIPEAWLVDLTNDRIEIHTQPSAAGYGSRRLVSWEGSLPVPGTETALDLLAIFGRG